MDVEDRLTAAAALLLVATLAARSRIATTLAAPLLVATTLATGSRVATTLAALLLVATLATLATPSPPLLTTAS